MSRRYVIASAAVLAAAAGGGRRWRSPAHRRTPMPPRRSASAPRSSRSSSSRAKDNAGSVTFRVINKGHVSHDFKIAGKKTSLLKPGKSQSITLKLKKGTYSFLCTVKGHAAAGMKGKFRVS